jgi:hypothetical protein
MPASADGLRATTRERESMTPFISQRRRWLWAPVAGSLFCLMAGPAFADAPRAAHSDLSSAAGTADGSTASRWSRPVDLGRGIPPSDSFPRAAIAADGTSAVVWWAWQPAASLPGRPDAVKIATGTPGGRFSAPRHLASRVVGGPLELFPFALGDGRFMVIWSDSRGLQVSRHPGRTRTVLEDPAMIADVARDGSGWLVLYRGAPERAGYSAIRIARLDARGRLRGPTISLGTGYAFPRWDRGGLLHVDDRGTARAVWTMASPSPFGSLGGVEVMSVRPRGGSFAAPVILDEQAREAAIAGRPGAGAVVTWTREERTREWGAYGSPQLLRPSSAAALPVPTLAAEPARGTFAPRALPLDRRRTLVIYQFHDPARMSLTGAVRATVVDATGSGRVQRLTDGKSKEPRIGAISGARALVAWARAGTWKAALAGADGVLRSVAAPRGPAARSNHSAQTNRDLRTGGRYAILAWDSHGRVRASVARF